MENYGQSQFNRKSRKDRIYLQNQSRYNIYLLLFIIFYFYHYLLFYQYQFFFKRT